MVGDGVCGHSRVCWVCCHSLKVAVVCEFARGGFGEGH